MSWQPAPVNEYFLELPISRSPTSAVNSGRLVLSGGEDQSSETGVEVEGGRGGVVSRDEIQSVRLGSGETLIFLAENVHAFADEKRKHSTFEIHVRGDQTGAVLQAEVRGCAACEPTTC